VFGFLDELLTDTATITATVPRKIRGIIARSTGVVAKVYSSF
jgi:hypothetical protein